MDDMARSGLPMLSAQMNCLHALAQMQQASLPLNSMLARAADILRHAWLPNDACVRITVNRRVYQSGTPCERPSATAAEMVAAGRRVGILEVLYRNPLDGPEGEAARRFVNVAATWLAAAIENASRQSDVWLKTIGDLIPFGTWACDADGSPTFFSNPFLRLLGMTLDEAKQQNIWGRMPPEDRLRAQQAWQQAIRQGQFWDYEYDIVGNDGRRSAVLARGVPIRDEDGTITSWVGINLDITARKELESALQSFADTIFETAQSIIIVVDAQGCIQRVNAFTQSLTGYSVEQVRGRHLTEFIAPEHAAVASRELGRALAGESVHGVEVPVITRDGRTVLVSWYASPLRNADGSITGVLGIGHDVTEIRQKEEQLRHAAKMEAIGRLAGGVAHDFNNYLTTITGYSHMILQDMPADEPARLYVDEITKAASRAAQLTRQLLTFSRKAIINPQVINLNRIISDMRNPLKLLLGEDIHMAMNLDTGAGCIKADTGQMQQVIMNLAANARDAMPRGGRFELATSEIVLNGEFTASNPQLSPGPHVMLIVSDNGIGMNAQVLSHIFDPFFTTKPVGQGTGLGLATVHGIVNQSSGHITVTSKPGQGTTFHMYFPRVAAPQPAEQPGRRPDGGAGSETIMLVDDDVSIRHFLMRVLASHGYKVVKTGSPFAAVNLLQETPDPIDLLVTDVVMPEMNGPQLAERLREIRPGLKVLFISGYTRDALVRRGVLEEGVKLLAKPFMPEELVDWVRKTLDQEAGK